jgi:hypothetical protein
MGAFTIAALPEIAIGGSVVAILGATGTLAGSMVQVGLGVVELSGGLAVSGEAKSFVLGISNPIAAWAAGLAALSGDPKIVQEVVEGVESLERLHSFYELPHVPRNEKTYLRLKLFEKPLADMLIEQLANPDTQSNKNDGSVDVEKNPVSVGASQNVSQPQSSSGTRQEQPRSPERRDANSESDKQLKSRRSDETMQRRPLRP